jgi:two-component system chemotaxis response regulator CheY
VFDAKARILIVDDMNTMRKLLGKVCQDLGFLDVTEAADGASAWQAVSRARPPIELIISDWNMPRTSGLDLLKRVRSDSRYSKLPFVLVTAEAEEHQMLEAFDAGASGYVTKPFSAESLRLKLEQVHASLRSGPAKPPRAGAR